MLMLMCIFMYVCTYIHIYIIMCVYVYAMYFSLNISVVPCILPPEQHLIVIYSTITYVRMYLHTVRIYIQMYLFDCEYYNKHTCMYLQVQLCSIPNNTTYVHTVLILIHICTYCRYVCTYVCLLVSIHL